MNSKEWTFFEKKNKFLLQKITVKLIEEVGSLVLINITRV